VSDFILESETDDTNEEEEYVPNATPPAADATRGCMENASLNTGANCKRYICTVLHNVMVVPDQRTLHT
jgi:hypothetical protein